MQEAMEPERPNDTLEMMVEAFSHMENVWLGFVWSFGPWIVMFL